MKASPNGASELGCTKASLRFGQTRGAAFSAGSLCEGEKSADAAQRLFAAVVAIASAGGSRQRVKPTGGRSRVVT